ncbi:hypothetical protein LTR37_004314 [Vermiconidia calcicola]|uniref:Uncharacterized protein n=1 Tax=Vermiconidia calcicola TaxID=1690605 RepID=A0ACC3NNX8_9PEZI|nr:hypothetical protein LTR37_004314 [Vermiconidia calcicola]
MSSKTETASNTPAPVVVHKVENPTEKVQYNITLANKESQGRDVSVQLQYLRNDPLYDTVKPLQITPNFLDNEGRSNVRLEAGPPEIINDIRGRQDQFTLDGNGFCYVSAPTSFQDWSSQPQIGKKYLPELEELLKREVEGCDEIIFYDARIRQEGDEGARVQGLSFNPFARQVHVDNTETSVLEKIRSITEMKADYYLSGRARIINIWRPIKHPVYDCGLAVADGATLRHGDVLECDRHRQDTGQYWDTMGVIKYRPGYDWYYMSRQDEQDVLLFKNYDSALDVPARNCLHTAFDLPSSEVPVNSPTRESIEVRALVFTHPKGFRRPSGNAMPHPLALHLEQEDLKLVFDEHSITDRLRTDIDEGNEVKDAVLLLRRQEIRRLEHLCEALVAERDELQRERDNSYIELKQAHKQIAIQTAHAEALQSKVRSLEAQRAQQHSDTHKQIQALSTDRAAARLYEQLRVRDESDGISHGHRAGKSGTNNHEAALLLQHIDRQQAEIDKWKAEAMGKGSEAVSRCWQGSVDEAVRSERGKDSFLIRALTDEMEKLRAAR